MRRNSGRPPLASCAESAAKSGFLIVAPSGPRWRLPIAAASCGIAAGVATRCCATAFALSYSAYVLSERSIFNNHYYLYVILAWLIMLVGGDEAVSIARWRRDGRRDHNDDNASTAITAAAPTIAAWKRDLLRLQLCIVYAYAGIAKMNADW